MKKTPFILLAFLSCILVGCVGDLLQPKADPTEFYLLRPIKAESAKGSDVGEQEVKNTPKRLVVDGTMNVNFMPFSLPSYMGRNQIVSLLDDGRVEISEFNRWGELPIAGFHRVLLEDIVVNVANVDIYNYPAVSFDSSAPNIRLFVADFIGELGEEVVLKGRWQIHSSDASKNVEKTFIIIVKCADNYASYVDAMNKAIFQLSREIAQGIVDYKNLKKETVKK